MKAIILLFLICTFGNVKGSNYFFSSSAGVDTRTAAEAQNPATPWKSISKLNSIFSTLLPGDSIIFKSGEVFDGSITVTKSGSVTSSIVFSSYGTGAKPVINGFTTITNWTAIGNGVYESYNANYPTAVKMFCMNNMPFAMGRYPNNNAANKGYLTFETHNTNLSLTDNELSSATNWAGAEVVIRTNHWVIDRRTISSQTGTTIAFTPASTYYLKDRFGYFIQNDIRTLDQKGEWYYNAAAKKMNVYLGTALPSTYVIKAAVENTLVKIYNQNNITFNNLAFTGSNNFTFDISNAQNISIKNCAISFSGTDAINGSGAGNVKIENNTFLHTNNSGINLGYNCSNNTIRNNTIRNTTLYAGMLKSGNTTGLGIYVNGANNLVEYNTIDSSGFTPIRFSGDYAIVKNNFISNFNFVKDDEGGIYTWNNNPGAVLNVGRKITGNIIINGIGANEGTEGNSSADGIYMDDNSGGVEIKDNTVANCNNNGIYIHDSHNMSILNNTLYNNKAQITYKYDSVAPNGLIRNMTAVNNIFFAKQPTQLTSKIETIANDIALMGSFNNNYYCRPLNDQSNVYNCYVSGTNLTVKSNMDLATWKPVYNQDSASRITPRQIPAFKVQSINSANKFGNQSFNTNTSGVYTYTTATTYSTTWNSGGKLDGGCFQGSVSSTAPCTLLSHH